MKTLLWVLFGHISMSVVLHVWGFTVGIGYLLFLFVLAFLLPIIRRLLNDT